eukprot:TRINITY_DN55603_c0_g1_i1.p1 TRINITY_DN55603_c0_g1~~TRINITY_DN55603_c0_g1_i1.p1  ORF type:complete len:853 (-),score=160.39 TRINITY_DN55603_c0_g1_i1:293-2851(-)
MAEGAARSPSTMAVASWTSHSSNRRVSVGSVASSVILDAVAITDEADYDYDDEDEDGNNQKSGALGKLMSAFGSSRRADVSSMSRSERRVQSKIMRQQKYNESRASRTIVAIVDEEQHAEHKERPLAAGEEALIRDKRCLEFVSAANIQLGGGLKSHGKLVSPISKNLERVKQRVEERASHKLAHQQTADLERCRKLPEWFDAGLRRLPELEGGGLAGKRPLPFAYQQAAWASDEVPLIFHKNSVTVVWPARLDLMPFFQEMERAQHGKVLSKASTTVFHYTSQLGMRNIVRPADGVEECTVQEPHEWGEEIWTRIEEDLEDRNVPEVAEAPAFSLPFCASEPSRLDSKENVLKAVFRKEEPTQAPTTVGYCIALLVPLDQCIAVAGRLSTHTVVVMPPGQENLSDVGSQTSADDGKRIASWYMRAHLKKNNRDKAVQEKVEQLELLSGLVDRETGRQLIVAEPEEKEFHLEAAKQKIMTKYKGKSIMDAMEEVEDMLRHKHNELKEKQVQLQRKVKQSERLLKRQADGEEVPLLLVDKSRLDRLKEKLQHLDHDVHLVAEELAQYEDTAPGEKTPRGAVEAGGEGTPAGDGKPKRKKKANASKASEFSADVKGSVHEISEEYHGMGGDVFREVFGGNIVGVAAWLRHNGDPNEYNETTGWTPLIMATSAGDPEMVSLLMKSHADPRKGSKSEGLTPMHVAVQKNDATMLNTILHINDQGIREKSKNGTTPLLMAVRRAPAKMREEFTKILLEGTSDPNALDMAGWNPLSIAVFRNYRGVVRLLVSNRGNVLEDCPETEPKLTIWQVASRHRGLQQLIKTKLSSRDMHLIEKRFPGSLGQKISRKDDDDDDD